MDIGTRVTLFYDDQEQVTEYFPTRGFMSASAAGLHFGLGSANTIDSVIVRWPDLSVQVLRNVTANERLLLDIGNANDSAYKNTGANSLKRLVSKTGLQGLAYKHIEDIFEFKHELLVPRTLFAEGPALSIADINGDGLQDIFAGSAKGQPSELFLQQPDASFIQTKLPVFLKDRFYETTDAAFFDADGDKDTDLYLVRGGSEVSLGDTLLADRLLINDGSGNLSLSAGTLPSTTFNGSCAAPGDFDNDGDIDLFVGSGSVPAAYGLSPKQLLLENDGNGNFSDATDRRMKNLRKTGMVTDALWLDYDQDKDEDLILVGEWMKVTVLNNDEGFFTDKTSQAGLGETSGWWNCINSCDIDNDGDTDLIGGNHGTNSILRASVKEPLDMYLNDFDDNGTLDQVICSYQDGVSYPVASIDQLDSQITGTKNKFSSYSDFAGKTAKDIFGSKAINKAVKKNAVLFESCLFINEGDGTFKTIRLPAEAQFSPVQDILTADLNKDGKTDIVLVGNDYSMKPVYGRQDASYGWCLLNDGNNGFKALFPSESGFIVKGDARKVVQAEISGKQYIIVAVNNGDLQVFECIE